MPVHNTLTTLQNGARARLRSVPLQYTHSSIGLASILVSHGFIHSAMRGTLAGPDPSAFNAAGPAARRLWIDLKYGNDDRPVLAHARVVSKPSKKISLDASELLRLVTGRRAKFVSPLQLGEIAIVKHRKRVGRNSEEEWLEAKEAVGRGVGGEVVARVG